MRVIEGLNGDEVAVEYELNMTSKILKEKMYPDTHYGLVMVLAFKTKEFIDDDRILDKKAVYAVLDGSIFNNNPQNIQLYDSLQLSRGQSTFAMIQDTYDKINNQIELFNNLDKFNKSIQKQSYQDYKLQLQQPIQHNAVELAKSIQMAYDNMIEQIEENFMMNQNYNPDKQLINKLIDSQNQCRQLVYSNDGISDLEIEIKYADMEKQNQIMSQELKKMFNETVNMKRLDQISRQWLQWMATQIQQMNSNSSYDFVQYTKQFYQSASDCKQVYQYPESIVQQRLKYLEQQNKQLEQDKSKLENTIQQYIQKYSDLEQKVRKGEQQAVQSSKIHKYSQEIIAMNQNIKVLKDNLDTSNKELNEFKEKIDYKEKQIDELNNNLQQVTTERENLSIKCKDLEIKISKRNEMNENIRLANIDLTKQCKQQLEQYELYKQRLDQKMLQLESELYDQKIQQIQQIEVKNNNYQQMSDERLCFELQDKYLIKKIKIKIAFDAYKQGKQFEINDIVQAILNKDDYANDTSVWIQKQKMLDQQGREYHSRKNNRLNEIKLRDQKDERDLQKIVDIYNNCEVKNQQVNSSNQMQVEYQNNQQPVQQGPYANYYQKNQVKNQIQNTSQYGSNSMITNFSNQNNQFSREEVSLSQSQFDMPYNNNTRDSAIDHKININQDFQIQHADNYYKIAHIYSANVVYESGPNQFKLLDNIMIARMTNQNPFNCSQYTYRARVLFMYTDNKLNQQMAAIDVNTIRVLENNTNVM